jgi:type IV secretory pathway TrbD component
MYKPLFLGISNAPPAVVYGVLIIFLVWLATAAGFAIWFMGHCVVKLISRIRAKTMRK